MPTFVRHKEKIYKIARWIIDILGVTYPVTNELNEKETINGAAAISWHFSRNDMRPATEDEYLEYLGQAK